MSYVISQNTSYFLLLIKLDLHQQDWGGVGVRLSMIPSSIPPPLLYRKAYNFACRDVITDSRFHWRAGMIDRLPDR